MATTKNNVIVKGASGKFGRQIVFSQRAGKTIMSKPPLRTAPPTTKQKEQQTKFARAAAYAKNALLDPTLKRSLHHRSQKTPRCIPLQYGYDRLPPPAPNHPRRLQRLHRRCQWRENLHRGRRCLQNNHSEGQNHRRQQQHPRRRQCHYGQWQMAVHHHRYQHHPYRQQNHPHRHRPPRQHHYQRNNPLKLEN